MRHKICAEVPDGRLELDCVESMLGYVVYLVRPNGRRTNLWFSSGKRGRRRVPLEEQLESAKVVFSIFHSDLAQPLAPEVN